MRWSSREVDPTDQRFRFLRSVRIFMKISGLGYFFETKRMVASISTSHFTLSRARPKGVTSSTSEIWSDLHENHRIRVFLRRIYGRNYRDHCRWFRRDWVIFTKISRDVICWESYKVSHIKFSDGLKSQLTLMSNHCGSDFGGMEWESQKKQWRYLLGFL